MEIESHYDHLLRNNNGQVVQKLPGGDLPLLCLAFN